MRITAITKFKHGALYAALCSLGWTQSEFARRCGLSAQTAGEIINLQKKPSPTLADQIQKILGEHGVYIDPCVEWPETYVGHKDRVVVDQTKDIDPLEVEYAKNFYQIQEPYRVDICFHDVVEEALQTLPPREEKVVRMRYGIGLATDPLTYREISNKLDISIERARQLEKKALKRLKFGNSLHRAKAKATLLLEMESV